MPGFHTCTVSLSGVETGKFQEEVITMVADAWAPCIARASTAMVLIVHYEQVFVFYEEGFQLTVPFPWWKMIGNANKLLFFLAS